VCNSGARQRLHLAREMPQITKQFFGLAKKVVYDTEK